MCEPVQEGGLQPARIPRRHHYVKKAGTESVCSMIPYLIEEFLCPNVHKGYLQGRQLRIRVQFYSMLFIFSAINFKLIKNTNQGQKSGAGKLAWCVKGASCQGDGLSSDPQDPHGWRKRMDS